MLTWVVTFLIIAIIAAIFGFGGIVEAAIDIAKIIFYVFIILFIISLVLHIGNFNFDMDTFRFNHN